MSHHEDNSQIENIGAVNLLFEDDNLSEMTTQEEIKNDQKDELFLRFVASTKTANNDKSAILFLNSYLTENSLQYEEMTEYKFLFERILKNAAEKEYKFYKELKSIYKHLKTAGDYYEEGHHSLAVLNLKHHEIFSKDSHTVLENVNNSSEIVTSSENTESNGRIVFPLMGMLVCHLTPKIIDANNMSWLTRIFIKTFMFTQSTCIQLIFNQMFFKKETAIRSAIKMKLLALGAGFFASYIMPKVKKRLHAYSNPIISKVRWPQIVGTLLRTRHSIQFWNAASVPVILDSSPSEAQKISQQNELASTGYLGHALEKDNDITEALSEFQPSCIEELSGIEGYINEREKDNNQFENKFKLNEFKRHIS